MPVFPSEQRSTKCSIMATVISGQTAELGGVLCVKLAMFGQRPALNSCTPANFATLSRCRASHFPGLQAHIPDMNETRSTTIYCRGEPLNDAHRHLT